MLSPIDAFLERWLRWGRYPWSRLRRRLLEGKYLKAALPSAGSPEQVADLLAQVTWSMDGLFHLYDAISYPQAVWSKKRDDCYGFAVLAAELLRQADPATTPVLLTAMLHPVRKSHTVCLFRHGDSWRFFDNARLEPDVFGSYRDIALRVASRGKRLVCWDVADPRSLRALEFHRD